MPKLRALWHAVRGATDLRRAGGKPSSVIDSLGVLPGKPHVMHVRPGLLDTDLNYHMNNAAFLSQAEFARCVRACCPNLGRTAARHAVAQEQEGTETRCCTRRWSSRARLLAAVANVASDFMREQES